MVLLTMDNLQLWVSSDLGLSTGTSMDGSVVSRLLNSFDMCIYIYYMSICIYLYTHTYIFMCMPF